MRIVAVVVIIIIIVLVAFVCFCSLIHMNNYNTACYTALPENMLKKL